MAEQDRVFVGTLEFSTDSFLLAPRELSGANPFIDVDFPFVDERFNHQSVSIWGHMGERRITEGVALPSLIAREVVLQEDIARRAFEIWKSEEGGSSLDNWLRAERELLRTREAAAGAAVAA